MRISTNIILFLFFSITMSSCTKSKSVDEFSTNQSLWKSKNILNYSYTMRLVCFCIPSYIGPNTERVVNGKIVSVNGKPYDESVTGKLFPITEYFDFLTKKLAQKPFRSNISYNPKYGYPEIVYFDFSEGVADDEIRYAITSFIVN